MQSILKNRDTVRRIIDFMNEDEIVWIRNVNLEYKYLKLNIPEPRASQNYKYRSIVSVNQLSWILDFKNVEKEELLRRSIKLDNIDMFLYIVKRVKERKIQTIDLFEFFLYTINNTRANFINLLVDYLDNKAVNNLEILEEIILGNSHNILTMVHQKGLFTKHFIRDNFSFVVKDLCRYSLNNVRDCLRDLKEIDYLLLIKEACRVEHVEMITWIFDSVDKQNIKEVRYFLLKHILVNNNKWIHTSLDYRMFQALSENNFLFNLFENKEEVIGAILQEYNSQYFKQNYASNITSWHVYVFPVVIHRYKKECISFLNKHRNLKFCFTPTELSLYFNYEMLWNDYDLKMVHKIKTCKFSLTEMLMKLLTVHIVLIIILYLLELYFPHVFY